jgi:hypothetical protein
MTARYMLDTNICIYLRQNRPPEVTTRFRQMQHATSMNFAATSPALSLPPERSSRSFSTSHLKKHSCRESRADTSRAAHLSAWACFHRSGNQTSRSFAGQVGRFISSCMK